jgi:hypothetical protein
MSISWMSCSTLAPQFLVGSGFAAQPVDLCPKCNGDRENRIPPYAVQTAFAWPAQPLFHFRLSREGLHAGMEMKPIWRQSVDGWANPLMVGLKWEGLRSLDMIADDHVDELCEQISRVRKELDQFKDVVANAVSKLNARITALEEGVPAPRGRIRR